jgi:hypothetical protein
MQAVVVDIPGSATQQEIHSRISTRLAKVRSARNPGARRVVEILKKLYPNRREYNLGVPDVVMLRSAGRLAVPAQAPKTRAGNDITFTFPTAGTTGSWPVALQADLNNIIAVIYTELKTVYGDPSWTGTVKIVNGDNTTPIIADPDALSGGAYNVSTNEILFAQYRSVQSTVYNLTQMMALAFRGPASISNDAWERGMARGATLQVLRNAKAALSARASQAFGGTLGDYDLADPLWHSLDRYDLINQPALGNDRFFPVSKANGEANTSTFPNMLVPRLQMAASAWLKVLAEDPAFMVNFNAAYYAALATTPGLKNSVPDLKTTAKTVLVNNGVTTVEGLDFMDWYQRQYILDTSVSLGTKFYANMAYLRPASGADDFSTAIILIYYRTALDGSGNSDEINLNGITYPIYWDFGFATRLFLAAQYERVDVRDGIGSVAPTFFNNLGGETALNSRMRVTAEFPINSDTLRLYLAPRSSGTQTSANNFFGTVIGADTGTIRIQTDTGVDAVTDVKQGAFGAAINANAFSRPNRATLTFTPTTGSPTVRRVVVGYNEYTTTFYVNDPVASKTATLPAGLTLVSFPIRPLTGKPSDALLNPSTDQPLFTDGSLLMAQWKQNLSGEDRYLRGSSVDPISPGKGYWLQLASATPVKIVGRAGDADQDISTGLINGWNQIGAPGDTEIDINNLLFQYLADNNPVTLSEAVTKGWIVAQNVPGVGNVAVWDYDPAIGYLPATKLTPWKGYWIRVLVSEGVTITFPSPTRAARIAASRQGRTAVETRRGWSLPLTVRDSAGLGSTVVIGQADTAGAGYDAKFDAQLPPTFGRSAPLAAIRHTDWGSASGDYYTDIRGTGNRQSWTITVSTPNPTRTYTLLWGDMLQVPRTTRLVMIDKTTGTRRYLNSGGGYSFTPGESVSRTFEIVPEIRTYSAMRILNVTARPSRGPGSATVSLTFDLSQSANVTTEILGANGGLVRRLQVGRASETGTNQLVWDTRDDRSIQTPSGVYMVRITAVTPEGERATVVHPITLVR